MARQIGDFAVAGQQMKVSATARLQLVCRCGWSIEGHIDGEDFIGDPRTQVLPS